MTCAIALPNSMTTGARSVSVSVRTGAGSKPTGARFVRTERGLALFDERGRYVGTVESPIGSPTFGADGATVLVRREA